MDKGAAILDFGAEDWGMPSNKPFTNDGPDLSANNLSANKVTKFNKIGTPSDETKLIPKEKF